eukprot:48807-Chlamydomonas_euryale.AAC.1
MFFPLGPSACILPLASFRLGHPLFHEWHCWQHLACLRPLHTPSRQPAQTAHSPKHSQLSQPTAQNTAGPDSPQDMSGAGWQHLAQ